jgi:dsDNA-specific endonuclease/ATPase MutS2
MDALENHSLHALDWPEILSALAGQSRCQEGKNRAEQLVLFEEIEQAKACFQAVEELQRLESLGDELPTSGLINRCAALEAAEKGRVLDLAELSQIADCIGALFRLEKWIHQRSEKGPFLAEIARPITVDLGLKENMRKSFSEPGVLCQRHYPEKPSLLNPKKSLNSTIKKGKQKPPWPAKNWGFESRSPKSWANTPVY